MSRKKAGSACDRRAHQGKTESISCGKVAVPAPTSSEFAAHPQASPSKPTIAFVTPTNPDQAELDRLPYSEPFFDPPTRRRRAPASRRKTISPRTWRLYELLIKAIT